MAPVWVVYGVTGGDVVSCGYDNMCAHSHFSNTSMVSALPLMSLLGVELNMHFKITDSRLASGQVKHVRALTKSN